VRSELDRGTQAFRKLLVPSSIEPSDNLNALLNKFDNTSLKALISLFYALDRVLFEEPVTVAGGDTTYSRYLVEYLSDLLIGELAQYIQNGILTIDETKFPGRDPIIKFFKVWLANVCRAVGESPADEGDLRYSSETVAREIWQNRLQEITRNFDEMLRAGSAAVKAEEAAAETIRARDAALRAAGQTGVAYVGKHFDDVAKTEGRKAGGWTAAAFLAIGAILWISSTVVHNSINSRWADALLHMVVVLPIIGAATYASTLARHHRVIARWAKTAKVQVNTVEAFSKQLVDTDSQDELILTLGKSVFTAPNYGDEAKHEQFTSVPAEVLDVLKELAKRLPKAAH
jgi:hypothetical protein